MSWAERAWQLRRNHHVLRFTRYTIGSVVGAVVAESAFLFSYALFDHIGPAAASAIAFFAGAVPKYFLNRDWVWAERDGSRRWRELSRYAAVVVISIGVSAVVTRFVESHADAVTHDHSLQVLLVGAAYGATFVVLFIARYFVFDKLVFVDAGGRRGGDQHGDQEGGGTGGGAVPPPPGGEPDGSSSERPGEARWSVETWSTIREDRGSRDLARE